MAKFTTTNLASTNLPPNVIGDITLDISRDEELVFDKTMFTTQTIPQYNDPEGDSPYQIKITSLPLTGALTYDNLLVDVDDEFYYQNLDLFELKYVPDANIIDAEALSFTFEVSDTGSLLFSGPGTVYVNIESSVNQPPSVVGDGMAELEYGKVKTFTVEDFTLDTDPQYEDPEGDLPSRLKILSLPEKGRLSYNNIPVVLNQIITFQDIADGLLTQTGEIGDTTSYDMVFDFAIADVGSEIFVE